MAELIVRTSSAPSVGDRRMEELALYSGITVRHATTGPLRDLLDDSASDSLSLAIDAATLDTHADTRALVELSALAALHLFVYHCTDDPQQQRALRKLTGDRLDAILAAQSSCGPFHFEPAARPLCGPLAGLSFTQTSATPLASFALATGSDACVLLTAQGRPILVQLPFGKGSLTLSTVPLPRLDEPLSSKNPLQAHALAVLPPLLFLRQSFGNRCWHPSAPTAQIVLDDPPLVRRYGCVDFDALQTSMERARYRTTLAFIPWNSWRTRRLSAQRRLAPPSRLSLCIHGCDHTRREFATHSEEHLRHKALKALQRMQRQQKKTGAEFASVMVFPQGFFSHEALAALRSAQYLAAVNTACFAIDQAAQPLTLAQALQPAITQTSGFPLFQRFPVRDLFDFAFALFLGKPALAVVHHGDFRSGDQPLEDFVDALHRQSPTLDWPPLSEQLSRCCLRKTLDDESEEIRFFTQGFHFARLSSSTRRILLAKPEPAPARIARVLLDGFPVAFSFCDGFLHVEIAVEGDQQHRLEIIDHEQALPPMPPTPLRQQAKILLRRAASELRDRVLYRYPRLLAAAQTLARCARLTANR